jgi:hypothetical protein
MIKTLIVGLWAGGVALGGAYLAMMLNAEGQATADSGNEDKIVEFINTGSMSIPVIRDGKVTGYVVTEMSFAVHKSNEGGEAAAPTPYLVDAAYRMLYQNVAADFSHLKPQDLKEIAEVVKKEANTRLGGDTVQDVLVSSLNFIARDEIRADWFKQKR